MKGVSAYIQKTKTFADSAFLPLKNLRQKCANLGNKFCANKTYIMIYVDKFAKLLKKNNLYVLLSKNQEITELGKIGQC